MTLLHPAPLETLNALEVLTRELERPLAAVNQHIIDRMTSPVALIPQLARYIISSGGKRIRPLLTLASARLCGHQGGREVGLAAAVEFIHTATLLHDDVVDESDLRRGQASANALFGNKSSVLVGDFLFARAFELMTQDGSIDVLNTLARASAVISEGEVLQLSAQNDIETTRETYLEVIEAKTAALFAASCRIGALVADRPHQEAEALDRYGRSLGMAFQLIDDALDYSAEQERLGKAVGDDFAEGKITLPIIIAVAKASDEERGFWVRTIVEGQLREGDLGTAQTLVTQHQGITETVEAARYHAAVAKRSLDPFPATPIRGMMAKLADFVVDRDH